MSPNARQSLSFDPEQARLIDTLDSRDIYLAEDDRGRICGVVEDSLITGEPSIVTSCIDAELFHSHGLSILRSGGDRTGAITRQELTAIVPDDYSSNLAHRGSVESIEVGRNSFVVHMPDSSRAAVDITVSGPGGTITFGDGGVVPVPTEATR